MSLRALKQYIELYCSSGISDFLLNLKVPKLPFTSTKQGSLVQPKTRPPVYIPEPLIELRKQCESCSLCAFRKDRGKLVFGKGSVKAKCLILGNPVNADENLSGLPFGRSNSTIYSEQFNKIVQKGLIEGYKLKITGDDLYLTNITKCRVMTLDYEQIKKCVPYFIKQIEIIKPKIILIFGEIAANALFEKTEHIDYYRNNPGMLYNGIPVYVTFNPSDMIKMETLKKVAWSDLKHFSEAYRNICDQSIV